MHAWNRKRSCQSEIEGNKGGWFDWAGCVWCHRVWRITWWSEHVGRCCLVLTFRSSIGWQHQMNTSWFSTFMNFTEDTNLFLLSTEVCLFKDLTTCMILTVCLTGNLDRRHLLFHHYHHIRFPLPPACLDAILFDWVLLRCLILLLLISPTTSHLSSNQLGTKTKFKRGWYTT